MKRWIRRRLVGLWSAVLLVFAANAAISIWVRSPEPALHDEFSYLLAADTFSHGRLTNPTHPHWPHFESFHILHRPTYQSKYPPGQGMVLALGQTLGGHPRVGLWIAMAFAAGALYWMLSALLPPRWALVGSVSALLQPWIVAWWGQTYWGGAVALAGAALSFGAVARLEQRSRLVDAVWLGVGIIILANTRPAEGVFACLVGLVWLAWSTWGCDRPKRTFLLKSLCATASILFVAGLWMGYYNFRITGDAFRPPYSVWLDTYQNPDVELRHREMREYGGSPDLSTSQKLSRLRAFYFPGLVGVVTSVMALGWVATRRRSHSVVLALGVCAAAAWLSASHSRGWPHYLAPMAPFAFFASTWALAMLYHGRFRGLRYGRLLVVGVLGVQLWNLARFYERQAPSIWFQNWQFARARIERLLRDSGGSHLILVRYAPGHDVHREWVYNEASIDQAKVVWAREMSSRENDALIDYFAYRTLWRLEADRSPPELTALRRQEGSVTSR